MLAGVVSMRVLIASGVGVQKNMRAIADTHAQSSQHVKSVCKKKNIFQAVAFKNSEVQRSSVNYKNGD